MDEAETKHHCKKIWLVGLKPVAKAIEVVEALINHGNRDHGIDQI